jgi:23S rRNA (pseudouridine1915-N3)-methyltransferase
MIRVIAVGRLKEPHYRAAEEEYLKRLGRYCKIEIHELKECTDKNPEVGKRKEAEQILARLKDGGYTVALDRTGRQMSSEEFSKLLRRPDMTFVIGGPDGLAREALDAADQTLSLSEMTLPHQMARVVLLEQIYRGHTILKGEKYHR